MTCFLTVLNGGSCQRASCKTSICQLVLQAMLSVLDACKPQLGFLTLLVGQAVLENGLQGTCIVVCKLVLQAMLNVLNA